MNVDLRTNFSKVGELYQHFGLPTSYDPGVVPHSLSQEDTLFRVRFLQEELQEIEEGYDQGDLAQVADGLIDLVVVAMGTAHLHGIPWEDLFDEVQRANMDKRRASSAAESKRGTSIDLVKPEGWKPPDIERILIEHGWKTQNQP